MYIEQELLFLKIWNLRHPIKALWKAGRMQLFNETRLVQRVQEEEDGVWPCKKWKARLKSQGSKIIGTNTEKCVQLCDQNINIHTESKTECVICSWQVCLEFLTEQCISRYLEVILIRKTQISIRKTQMLKMHKNVWYATHERRCQTFYWFWQSRFGLVWMRQGWPRFWPISAIFYWWWCFDRVAVTRSQNFNHFPKLWGCF